MSNKPSESRQISNKVTITAKQGDKTIFDDVKDIFTTVVGVTTGTIGTLLKEKASLIGALVGTATAAGITAGLGVAEIGTAGAATPVVIGVGVLSSTVPVAAGGLVAAAASSLGETLQEFSMEFQSDEVNKTVKQCNDAIKNSTDILKAIDPNGTIERAALGKAMKVAEDFGKRSGETIANQIVNQTDEQPRKPRP